MRQKRGLRSKRSGGSILGPQFPRLNARARGRSRLSGIRSLHPLPHRHGRRRRRTLAHYLIKIAKFGGYLCYIDRKNDPPPGNICRGLSRLTDICSGAAVGAELVGN